MKKTESRGKNSKERNVSKAEGEQWMGWGWSRLKKQLEQKWESKAAKKTRR